MTDVNQGEGMQGCSDALRMQMQASGDMRLLAARQQLLATLRLLSIPTLILNAMSADHRPKTRCSRLSTV